MVSHSLFRKLSVHLIAAATALVLGSAPRPAAADLPPVLNQVPADAPIVVLVPSLSRLSQKVATLHDALGLQVPQMADALGEMKHMTGIEQGLNDAGALAIVFTDAQRLVAQQPGPPPVVMLAPTIDYDAFVANYGGSGAEPVTTLALPTGQTVFAKRLGAHAALSADNQLLASFAADQTTARLPKTLVPAIADQLARGDVSVLVNVAAFAPMLQTQLQAAMNAAEMEMEQGLGASGMDPGTASLTKTVFSLYGDAINAALRDTNTLALSAELNDDGLTITKVADFKPGSSLANLIADKHGAAAYLGKFAQRPYLFAFAASLGNQDPGVRYWIDQVAAKLDGIDSEWVTNLLKPAIELMKPLNGFASVYYQPQQPAMMGGGMFQAVNILDVQDALTYIDLYKTYLEKLNGMSITMGPQGVGAPGPDGAAQAPTMGISTEYKPSVLQIDGVRVDDYQIKYEFPPQMMQQMAPMMMLMGGAGQGGYLAAKDNMVIMTTVRDADLLRQTLAVIGDGAGLGATRSITESRRALPQDAAAECYVSVPGLINGTVNMFMMMMGQPPIQVPPDLAPLAIGVGVDGTTLTGRLHVPMPVIRFAKDLANQFRSMGSQPAGGPTAGHPGPRRDQQGPPRAPMH